MASANLIRASRTLREQIVKHPLGAIGFAVAVVALSAGDLMQVSPGLASAVRSPYYRVFNEVHDLLALGLSLSIAYRWVPVIGVVGMSLYLATHVPYFLLYAGGNVPELLRTLALFVIGILTMKLIANMRRAGDRIVENNRQLATLHEISQEVSRSLDLETVAEQALQATLRVLNLDAGTVRYIDEVTGDVVLLTHYGLPEELSREIQANSRQKMGQGIAGVVAQSGTPLVIEALPEYDRLAYAKTASSGLQSCASLPLKVMGKAVGVITGFSYRRRAFTKGEINLMSSLGNMVGLAIANAQLFSRVEEGKRQWERTFDSVSDGMYLLNSDLRIVRANRALADLLGTTPKALVGRRCYEVMHGTDRPVPGCPAVRCLEEKRSGELVTREGHLGNRWLHLRTDPVLDPRGIPLSVVQSVRDVTDQKQAAEALARSASVNMAILDLVRVAAKGLVTTDVYREFAVKLQSLVPFDEASINLLDHTDRIFRAWTISAGNAVVTSDEIVPVEDRATVWVTFHNVMCVEQDISRDRRFDSDELLAKAGYRSVLRAPLSFGDQPFGSFELRSRQPAAYGKEEVETMEQLCPVLAHIIWYQHVAALEKAERLELQELDKAREEFVAFMAHELRTPLTPVMACAKVLAQDFMKGDGRTEDRCIRNIVVGAQTLEERLSDLLDSAQYRIGAFALQMGAVAPGALVADVASRFEAAAKGKGLSLVAVLPEDLPHINADIRRLEQVLANLVENALKFTPSGGSVRLSARFRENYLVFEVEDSGLGLSADEQQKLFRPQPRDELERRQLPGSGLGLALCKRLVEAHGGRIWVESKPGMGSKFIFAVPAEGPEHEVGDRS